MGMSNAEKQAAWRARRAQELADCRKALAEAQAEGGQLRNALEEVERLRNQLAEAERLRNTPKDAAGQVRHRRLKQFHHATLDEIIASLRQPGSTRGYTPSQCLMRLTQQTAGSAPFEWRGYFDAVRKVFPLVEWNPEGEEVEVIGELPDVWKGPIDFYNWADRRMGLAFSMGEYLRRFITGDDQAADDMSRKRSYVPTGLEAEVEARVRKEVEECLEIALKQAREDLKEAQAIKRAYRGVFTNEQYKKLLGFLHPDRHPENAEKANALFHMVREKEGVLCAAKLKTGDVVNPIPKTAREMMERRKGR